MNTDRDIFKGYFSSFLVVLMYYILACLVWVAWAIGALLLADFYSRVLYMPIGWFIFLSFFATLFSTAFMLLHANTIRVRLETLAVLVDIKERLEVKEP